MSILRLIIFSFKSSSKPIGPYSLTILFKSPSTFDLGLFPFHKLKPIDLVIDSVFNSIKFLYKYGESTMEAINKVNIIFFNLTLS